MGMWDKSPTRIPAAHCRSRKTDLSVPQLQPGPGNALQARTPEQPAKADILDTALWNLLGKALRCRASSVSYSPDQRSLNTAYLLSKPAALSKVVCYEQLPDNFLPDINVSLPWEMPRGSACPSAGEVVEEAWQETPSVAYAVEAWWQNKVGKLVLRRPKGKRYQCKSIPIECVCVYRSPRFVLQSVT